MRLLLWSAALAACGMAAGAEAATHYMVTQAVAGARGFDVNNSGAFVGVANLSDGSTAGFVDDGSLHYVGATAYGINTSGQVTGYTYDADFNPQAYVYINGTFAVASPPSATFSMGFAINDAGKITGVVGSLANVSLLEAIVDYSPADPAPSGYGYNNGGATIGLAINNRGDVVGSTYVPEHCCGFGPDTMLLGDTGGGTTFSLFYPGGGRLLDAETKALFEAVMPFNFGFDAPIFDINDSREFVGYRLTAEGVSAYIYDGTARREIRSDDLGNTMAYGLNERGDVVGKFENYAGRGSGGFLYQGGELHAINDLLVPGSGWNIIEARDINDAGQIVGTAEHGNAYYAVLLSPVDDVPEPASWAMILAGFSAIGASLRRAARHRRAPPRSNEMQARRAWLRGAPARQLFAAMCQRLDIACLRCVRGGGDRLNGK